MWRCNVSLLLNIFQRDWCNIQCSTQSYHDSRNYTSKINDCVNNTLQYFLKFWYTLLHLLSNFRSEIINVNRFICVTKICNSDCFYRHSLFECFVYSLFTVSDKILHVLRIKGKQPFYVVLRDYGFPDYITSRLNNRSSGCILAFIVGLRVGEFRDWNKWHSWTEAIFRGSRKQHHCTTRRSSLHTLQSTKSTKS